MKWLLFFWYELRVLYIPEFWLSLYELYIHNYIHVDTNQVAHVHVIRKVVRFPSKYYEKYRHIFIIIIIRMYTYKTKFLWVDVYARTHIENDAVRLLHIYMITIIIQGVSHSRKIVYKLTTNTVKCVLNLM